MKRSPLGSLLLAALLSACEPGPRVDLAGEASLVPWDRLRGRLVYARTRDHADGVWTSFFLIDTGPRAVRLLRQAEGSTGTGVAFSPDGAKVAYADFVAEESLWQLFALDVASTQVAPLFPTTQGHQLHPAWAPDGRLAFWHNGVIAEEPHFDELFVDGQPFVTGLRVDRSRAAWRPDGSALLISAEDPDRTQGALWTVDATTRERRLWRTNAGAWNQEIFSQPAWSPDGARVAWVRWGDALGTNSELWLANADGSGETQLTTGALDAEPAWSPDGQAIAFVRTTQASGSQVYLLDVATRDVVRVSSLGADTVSWTP